MKFISFSKQSFSDTLKIFFIIFTLMNSVFAYSASTSLTKLEENSFYNEAAQATSFIPEILDTRVNLKVLTVSFAEKFFSFDFCLKRPGYFPKLFTIISETDSETNSRNSSFLISELSTST